MKNLHIFLLATLCAAPALLRAQTDIARDLLLERSYDPSLQTAGKVHELPPAEATKTQPTTVQYALEQQAIGLNKEYHPLAASDNQAGFPHQDDKGYVRLGLGLHWSLLGDAQFNLLRDSRQRLDANLWSRSAFGAVKLPSQEKSPAQLSDNRLRLNYQYHFDQAVFSAELGDRVRWWNYYGGEDLAGTLEQLAGLPFLQCSNDLHLKLGWQSKPWERRFDYAVTAEDHLFYLHYPFKPLLDPLSEPAWENDLDVKGRLAYRFDENWKAGLDVSVRWLSQIGPTPDNTLMTTLTPTVDYRVNLWRFRLGAQLNLSDHFRIAPYVFASHPLGRRAFFELEVDGGERLFSYREGLDLNPFWLNYQGRIQNEYTPVAAQLRLTWQACDILSLTPHGGYKLVKNAAQFYLPYLSSQALNGTIFSDEYADYHHFHAGLKADLKLRNLFWLSGAFQWNHYLTSFDETLVAPGTSGQAVNRPIIETRVRADVKPSAHWNLFVEYHLSALRYGALEQADNTLGFMRLDNLHLLNLGADVTLKPRWHLFLHVNNILNQRYDVWTAYPTYGITPLLGFSFSF